MNTPLFSVFCQMIRGILFAAVLTGLSFAESKGDGSDDSRAPSGTKYIAFSTDAEAYYVTKFSKYQGDFSQEIVDVCKARGVPFTWLSVVDAKFEEFNGIFNKIYPQRKSVDEASVCGRGEREWVIARRHDEEGARDGQRGVKTEKKHGIYLSAEH